jgi:membrane protein insertase Oxa1/YidC/SpoIIIJ
VVRDYIVEIYESQLNYIGEEEAYLRDEEIKRIKEEKDEIIKKKDEENKKKDEEMKRLKKKAKERRITKTAKTKIIIFILFIIPTTNTTISRTNIISPTRLERLLFC